MDWKHILSNMMNEVNARTVGLLYFAFKLRFQNQSLGFVGNNIFRCSFNSRRINNRLPTNSLLQSFLFFHLGSIRRRISDIDRNKDIQDIHTRYKLVSFEDVEQPIKLACSQQLYQLLCVSYTQPPTNYLMSLASIAMKDLHIGYCNIAAQSSIGG